MDACGISNGESVCTSVGQPILAAVRLSSRRLDVLESVSAGKIACPKSIFEESTGMSIRALGLLWWGRLQPVNARLRAYFFTVSHPR